MKEFSEKRGSRKRLGLGFGWLITGRVVIVVSFFLEFGIMQGEGVDNRPRIKPEDRERYKKQVEESEGFDVDNFPGSHLIRGCILPVDSAKHEFYAKFLMPAIESYNQRQKVEGRSQIAFVRILYLTAERDNCPRFFYTLEARDVLGGTKRTYQARVDPLHNDQPPIFREKAAPPSSETKQLPFFREKSSLRKYRHRLTV